MAGWSNRWEPSHAWWVSVQVAPPRHTRPWRSKNLPSRLRARVSSWTMSALVRHRSRTASSWMVGMRMATSSPARCSRGEPAAVAPVGLGPCRPGALGISDGAITWQPIPMLCSSRASSKPVGPVLVAGSQHAGVAEAAGEPADRCLVMGDPLDVWDLLVGWQDPHRDGVLVDVQPQVDGRTTRDTGHGRLLPYVGSARLSVGDPRRCGPEPAVPC
jgi:hypothetical protein